MTRETKIGLLVGLAFIIVIGILLSDHMSSTNEPQSAGLSGAGSNVRDSVASPGSDGTPVSAAGTAPADAPRSPVTTHADLAAPPAPQAPPAGFVQVGPGRTAQPPVTIRQRGDSAAPPARPPETYADSGANANPDTRDHSPVPPSRGDVRELVLRHPDDFVPVGPNDGNRARPTAVPPSAPRTYAAEAGDSVSRIAAKMYGTNTKANRDLILRANPTLQAEGNRVLIGKVYVIPNLPTAAAPSGVAAVNPVNAGNPSPGNGATVASPAPTPRPMARRESADAADTWYTVKENDSLWKIAEAQLGTPNAWAIIRDMNKDTLKNGETVHPNMRLRLPPKPVASASAN